MKVQSSQQIVYKNGLVANIEAIKKLLPSGTMQMCVVKSDAYGHGAVEATRILEPHADWFAVATVFEAEQLRAHQIKKPILVFYPPTLENAHLYVRYNLTAVISELDHFDILLPGTQAHIEFDTGMGRLGFLPDQVSEVTEACRSKAQKLTVNGIMTHFASADEPATTSVVRQLAVFKEIAQHFDEKCIKHAANTGAVLHHRHSCLDMVRHGLGIYGYDPTGEMENLLTPVMEWWSQIIQCRKIPQNWPVSYESNWKATEDGNLCIVPVGYADGLPRLLQGKGYHVQIEGKWFPVVGNITMDYVMVFTGEKTFKTGTPVLMMGGDRNNARHLAAMIGTIPYEILTRIHPKAKRVYR